MLTKLNTLYTDYAEKVKEVRKKARVFDGFLGMGKDPRNDACHEAYYEAVGAWVAEFLETEPAQEETQPQESTEPTLPMVRRNVTFDLPQYDTSYILSIHQNGALVISGITIAPGTDSFAAEFSGAGMVTFDLYVNDSYHSSVTLEFVDG